jgi:hypothetical protein
MSVENGDVRGGIDVATENDGVRAREDEVRAKDIIPISFSINTPINS